MKKLLPVLLLFPFLGGCYWIPINIYHATQGPIQDKKWVENASDEQLCTWYYEPRRRSDMIKYEIYRRDLASTEGLQRAAPEAGGTHELELGMTKCEVMAATGYKPESIDRWEANGKRIEKWWYTEIAYIVFEDGKVNKIKNFRI